MEYNLEDLIRIAGYYLNHDYSYDDIDYDEYDYNYDKYKEDDDYGVEELDSLCITSILVNKDKKVITVIFSDGDVKMAKCSEKDEFDIKIGVALCMLYHIFGSSNKASKAIEQKVKFVNKKKKQNQNTKISKKKIKVDSNE